MRDPSGKKKPQATGKALQGPPDQGPGSSEYVWSARLVVESLSMV
jgi:hypothetical protein